MLDALLADDPRVGAAETHPSFDLAARISDVRGVDAARPLGDTLDDRLVHVDEVGLAVKVRRGRVAARDRDARAGFVRPCRARPRSIGSFSFFEPLADLEVSSP